MTTAAWPLLAGAPLDAPLAWDHGVPIGRRQFLADAAAQAQRLPAAGPAVNLCTGRYRFAVGFAAALLRGQTSLLPPNALPETLARLHAMHPDAYALGDADAPAGGALPWQPCAAPAPQPAADAPPAVAADVLAACLLTSGSTGLPQPHAKRWQALVDNVAAAAQRLAGLMERPSLAGVQLVATVPPQHSYGFESSVLLAMLGGAAFDTGRPFYPADIVQALERLPRPRVLVTTPFHLKTLLRSGVALPPVDLVLSATAPLSPQLAQESERRFGGRLVEIYGCTEAGQVATRRTAHGDLWQCFGALQVRREGEGDAERYLVEGGHVTEPTPLADVLQLDAPDRFRLLGRANDLVHVAGRRSSLAHLNHHLNSIDGVLDGTFWLPDEVADGVVRPVVFVVAPTLGAAQIVAALRARLEPAFVPRRVLQVEALPREATGKLTAQALARFARERLATEAPR